MTSELVPLPVILTLVALVVWQQIFWARQVHDLVDKLMSKSFAEYRQARAPKEPKAPKAPVIEVPEDMGSISGF